MPSSHLNEEAFLTDAEGRRLFCPHGPFSRQYVVSDEGRAATLSNRFTWYRRILTLVGVFIVVVWYPQLIQHSPWLLLACLAGMAALDRLAVRFLFSKELKQLPRLPTRLTLRSYHAYQSAKRSAEYLAASLMLSLIGMFAGFYFVWIGFAGNGGKLTVLGGGMALIFLVQSCSVVWILRIKRKHGPIHTDT